MISAERVVLERVAKDTEIGRRSEQRFITHDVVLAYRESVSKSLKL